MFKIATSLLLLALMLSLAGPATAAPDKGLGLVTQNNIAAMVVDLSPSYANVKIEGSDGFLADTALTRYRTGRVKPLMPLSGTTNIGIAGAAAAAAAAPQQSGPR